MHVFVFRSGAFPDVLGFTATASDETLPASFGPWTLDYDYELREHGSVVGVGSGETIIAAIQADGKYLAETGKREVDILTRPRPNPRRPG